MDVTVVRHGDQKIDPAPHLERVNNLLQVIRTEKLAEFLPLFVETFQAGATGGVLRKMGTPMTGAEKTAAGVLTSGVFPRELAGLITDAAKADPIRSVDDLVGCVVNSIFKESHRRRFDRLAANQATHFRRETNVRLVVLHHHACSLAMERQNAIYRWGEAPTLPMPGCTEDPRCACSYIWHR